MSTISPDLLTLDSRQAVLAPSVLLRLRSSSLDYATYLQLVMQDIAQGQSAQEWAEQMEAVGALTIAEICWRAAGMNATVIHERYQHGKEFWHKKITDNIQTSRQKLQRYKDLLSKEEITHCEDLLHEAQRYRDQEWYDLAQEALKQIEELLGPVVVAKEQEKEQLHVQIFQIRQILLTQHTLSESGNEGYNKAERLLTTLEQMLDQPKWDTQHGQKMLTLARAICHGSAYDAREVDLLLGEKPRIETPPAPVQPVSVVESVASLPPAPVEAQSELVALEEQAESEKLQQQGNYHRTISKDFGQAEELFKRALHLWPGNEAAAKNYANMLRQRKRLNDAIKVLEDGARYAQDRLPFYNLLSNYCTDVGEYDKARDYAQRALRLVGDARAEIGVLTILVTLEVKAGDIEKALEYIHAILRLNPHNDGMRKKKERLEAQLSGEGPAVVTTELEEMVIELVEPSIEISPLIREDLELCELTKVAPRILQSNNSSQLYFEAERLARETQQLYSRQYRERAEYFLQAAKLIVQASKDGKEKDAQRLEQFLNNYTGAMGDYLFGSGKLDSARDYYLEHIRLYRRSTLSWYTLMRIANYFQTFLPTEELRSQLASVVPRHTHKEEDLLPVVHRIIAKMGQLADTANAPDQELARGLLELACVSDLLSNTIWKAIETDEKIRTDLLPLLEILSSQSSISLTSNEPGDIFRQLVQDRHYSTKRQESQLNGLVASMGEKWSLEQAEEELAHFITYQREWSATDRTFFATVRDLVRRGHQYFFSEGRFSDKEPLATSIIHDVDTFRDDLKVAPTFLGKAYFARIVYQLKRLVEKEFQELRQVSLPRLVPSIVKATWLSEQVRECHIDIANEGESTAQDVKIRIVSTEETDDDYLADSSPHHVGSIYARPHVVSVAFPVTLTKKAASQIAVDLLVRLEYFDRDNSKKETDIIRLHLPLRDTVQFTPIKNPYRTGLPIVNSPMFIGRQELIEDLAREMTRGDRTSAVVIYGQKRSGKTSILRNLANYLAIETFGSYRILPIYLSMQSTLSAADEDKSLTVPTMFYLIADEISQICRKVGLEEIGDLQWDRLTGPNSAPTLQFRLYLERIRRLPNTRLILLIDEFTELSDKIDQGYVNRDIMKQLKSLIEQGFFSCVICGVDTMPDVLKKYANELAVSYPRMVGYLSSEAARELIEEPIRLPDGTSRFASPRVVEDLIQLTAGNPYYIQFLCYRLVEYMNRKSRNPTITGADLDRIVIDLITGSGPGALDPYTMFDNLTRYKDDEAFDTYETIIEGLFLYLLADETRTRRFAPFQAIRQRASFVEEVELLKIAQQLENRQVIVRSGGETARQYRIVVDLFRRWINAKRPWDTEMINKFRKQLEKANA